MLDDWKLHTDEEFKKLYDYFVETFNWNLETKFGCVSKFLEKKYENTRDVSYIYWSFRVINKYYTDKNFMEMNNNTYIMENLLFKLTNLMNTNIVADKLDKFNAIMMIELCNLYNSLNE